MAALAIKILIFASAGAALGKLTGSLLKSRSLVAATTADGMTLVGLMVGISAFLLSVYAVDAPGEPLASLDSEAQLAAITSEAAGPVIVKFEADWCGACKMFEPTVRKARDEWSGHAQFYAVDVDQSPALARKFMVDALPTLVVINNGHEYARVIGVQSHDTLNELIAAAKESLKTQDDLSPLSLKDTPGSVLLR